MQLLGLLRRGSQLANFAVQDVEVNFLFRRISRAAESASQNRRFPTTLGLWHAVRTGFEGLLLESWSRERGC